SQVPEGILDFSYLLDGPAGKKGFVKVKDGHFYFENGERIRFFGVNLVFGAAMPDQKMADIIADRLARSGINMVRFHHVDSYQKGPESNTLIDYSQGNSQSLHQDNVDRFDYLVSKLKEKGIYFHIDLFTLRYYLPGDDLDYPDDLKGALKQLNYFNQRLIELHKKFIKQYLTHKNPYTGLRYVDDPAVAVVQLLNENSIFWDNGEIEAPSYQKELDLAWNKWLLKKYNSRQGMATAWTNAEGVCALDDDEDPQAGTVQRPPTGNWGERKIDYNTSYKSLEGRARFADHMEFLAEIEKEYIKEMKEYLHEIGVKCPINASNLPGGAAELNCLQQGDVAENNGYWNHPMGGFRVPVTFHDKAMTEVDPRQVNVPSFAMNLVTKLASGRIADKPFVITEWNVCYPTLFRADVMPMLAAYASLQDWDGLLLFSYSHTGSEKLLETDKMSSFFNSFSDPAVWGQAGIASALFQQGLVKTAENQIDLVYTREDCTGTPGDYMLPYGVVPYISQISARFIEDKPYTDKADMILHSGFTPTGDYSQKEHVILYSLSQYKDRYEKETSKEEFLTRYSDEDNDKILEDNQARFLGTIGDKYCVIAEEQLFKENYKLFSSIVDRCMKEWNLLSTEQGQIDDQFRSDTDELLFNIGQNYFTVNTDKLKVFAGTVPGTVKLDEVSFKIENQKAEISLLVKEGSNFKDASQILLNAIGESENEGMQWEGKTLVAEGEGPSVIDPIQAEILLPLTGISVFALDQEGNRVEEIPVEEIDRQSRFRIGEDTVAINYEIVKA
ncbi:MAG: hypothetical protein ACOCVB_03020, partial [Bacillota bacterium]